MRGQSQTNISRARQARHFTQEQMADFLGVSRPTYINIEAGKKELTLRQAEALAAILRINFEDILGATDGATAFADVMSSTDKYKQIILNSIYFGADSDGRITKTKLAKLAYLSDFIWFYLHSQSMSGVTYRKLPRGPVADVYFRALDELEEDGLIVREPHGKAIMFSLAESVPTPHERLSADELSLIEKVSTAWRGQSTESIVNFTHAQFPWQICHDGEVIPYSLIFQEEPERIYGPVRL